MMQRARFLLLPAALFSLAATPAHAKWELNPKSSHELFLADGLLIDDQTSILFYGASRYWGSIGGAYAFFGNAESPRHPQFVIIASVNASMIFADSGRIYSDEIDVHAGGAFEFAINPVMRLSLGFMHFSGHAADGAVDKSLLGENYNLGDNMLFARFVFDLGIWARFGVTFQPVLHGGPDMNFFMANEFAEWFPLGPNDGGHWPAPFVAVGAWQGGTTQYGMYNTLNFMMGAYVGNRLSNIHKPTFRPVIGYYIGADQRLKYWQFNNLSTDFWYLGVMADY